MGYIEAAKGGWKQGRGRKTWRDKRKREADKMGR